MSGEGLVTDVPALVPEGGDGERETAAAAAVAPVPASPGVAAGTGSEGARPEDTFPRQYARPAGSPSASPARSRSRRTAAGSCSSDPAAAATPVELPVGARGRLDDDDAGGSGSSPIPSSCSPDGDDEPARRGAGPPRAGREQAGGVVAYATDRERHRRRVRAGRPAVRGRPAVAVQPASCRSRGRWSTPGPTRRPAAWRTSGAGRCASPSSTAPAGSWPGDGRSGGHVGSPSSSRPRRWAAPAATGGRRTAGRSSAARVDNAPVAAVVDRRSGPSRTSRRPSVALPGRRHGQRRRHAVRSLALDGRAPEIVRGTTARYPYLVDVHWMDGRARSLLTVQSRDQRSVEVLAADPATGDDDACCRGRATTRGSSCARGAGRAATTAGWCGPRTTRARAGCSSTASSR